MECHTKIMSECGHIVLCDNDMHLVTSCDNGLGMM